MTAYELKLQELSSRHDCDLCGHSGARPYDFTSIIDGSPIVAYHCASCQSEIDEANEHEPQPASINWREFFGVEDETSTLNTFYSGVEA